MFPPSDEHRRLVATIIPAAKATYYSVFEPFTHVQQMTIQANAERQGAGAWQNLKALHPDRADELDRLSEIEIGRLIISTRWCRHYRTERGPYSGRSFSGSRHLTGM